MTSTFDLKRSVYESLPQSIRALVGIVPFAWLAGRPYRTTYEVGRDIDGLDRDETNALMNRRLGETLRFAVEHVPYYHKFRDIVDRMPPASALQAFPLIDKDTVLASFEQFLCRPEVRPANYATTTGGTSGRQLKVLLEDASQSVEMAFMHRQWARVGYTTEARKATFRGVAFPRAHAGEFWQPNPIYREMQFSPMAMTEARLPEYWRRLLDYNPQYLHGYPSSIATLARFVLRNGLYQPRLRIRAALLGSEGCTVEQRELIRRAFRTSVFTWYGHSERLILGGECEHASDYHQFPDYGWLEILDDQGHRVQVGGQGEIVGTGFLNRVMPLIRYRTGDVATRLDWRCACGRAWDRFGQVEGRWKQEMVIGRNGAELSLTALNLHGPHFDHVARYQYFQDTPGTCEIRVVVDPEYTARDRDMIERAYAGKAGDEVSFKVREVSELTLTERGKLKLLVSRLKPSHPANDSPPGQ